MRWRRRLTVVYAVAAVALIPWIVLLGFLQSPTGLAHHLSTLTVVLGLAVCATAVVAAGVATRRPVTATILAAVAATVAVTSAWFRVVTVAVDPDGRPGWEAAGVGALVLVTVAALAQIDATSRARGPGRTTVVRWFLTGSSLLVVALVVHMALATSGVVAVGNLRTAWIGLDVMETFGLAATAWSEWHRSWWAVVAGSVTAALLTTDAAVNVLATSGNGQRQALAMTLVELPLAIGALAIARAAPPRRQPGEARTRPADRSPSLPA